MGIKEQMETFICQCHSVEHQFSFIWIDDEDLKDGEVYLEVHLKPLPFWQRFKNAIKYLFGHRSNYGDFDYVILRKSDTYKLERVVEYLKKQKC